MHRDNVFVDQFFEKERSRRLCRNVKEQKITAKISATLWYFQSIARIFLVICQAFGIKIFGHGAHNFLDIEGGLLLRLASIKLLIGSTTR